MDTNKTFFVTGATGNQGGATARNLAENGNRVIALVRDPDADKVEQLKRSGIEVVKGKLEDQAGYKQQLKNIDGAFAVFIYTEGIKKEIANGKSFIDAAKEMKVPFILYSSVIGADSGSGIPHWESKYQIEEYLKGSGIPYAIIRPASFFQNFFIPDVRKRIVKGTLVTPVRKDKTQQFISTDDVGKICAHILQNKEQYIGRTITVAADEMDMQSAAVAFSDVLGKPIKYSQLPGLLTRIFMGKDLHTMFNYVNKNDVCYVKDMNAVKSQFPFLTTMREWITKNKSSFTS